MAVRQIDAYGQPKGAGTNDGAGSDGWPCTHFTPVTPISTYRRGPAPPTAANRACALTGLVFGHAKSCSDMSTLRQDDRATDRQTITAVLQTRCFLTQAVPREPQLGLVAGHNWCRQDLDPTINKCSQE